jgi:hypothetical protein
LFQATSRSCSFRHARLNSTAKKISGNSCGRTGCRTEFSNPSTTSSITAATPGTRLSISRGKSCPSRAAIGQPQVTQSVASLETSVSEPRTSETNLVAYISPGESKSSSVGCGRKSGIVVATSWFRHRWPCSSQNPDKIQVVTGVTPQAKPGSHTIERVNHAPARKK